MKVYSRSSSWRPRGGIGIQPRVTSGLAHAASKLSDKLVELLEVFDLSFVISGAVGMGAILVAVGVEMSTLLDASAPVFIGGVVAAYFLGLSCFAMGRRIRGRLPGAVVPAQQLAAAADGLAEVDALGDLFVDGRLLAGAQNLLYDRLWVHVRTLPELSASFALLKRYWILAATFDGLAIAVLLWNAPAAVALKGGGSVGWAVVSLLTVVLSAFAFAQANEYRRYQAAELLATVRHWSALCGEERRLDLERKRAELQALRAGPRAENAAGGL